MTSVPTTDSLAMTPNDRPRTGGRAERRRARLGTWRGAAWLAPLVVLFGCSEPEEAAAPEWIDLTSTFEPAYATDAVVLEGDHLASTALRRTDSGLLASVTYTEDAWQPTPIAGLFVADLHVPRSFVEGARATRHRLLEIDVDATGYAVIRPSSASPASEANDEERPRSFTYVPSLDVVTDWADVPADSFGTVGHLLGLYVGPDGSLPEHAVHTVPVPVGGPEGDGWRLRTDRWSGAGAIVPPGMPQTFDLAAAGVDTSVRTRLELSCFARTAWAARELDAPVFRVSVDGTLRRDIGLDATLCATDGELRRFGFDVPEGARTITIEYDGPLGLTGVLEPVLGPRTRPVAADERVDPRPDLVLFVADTLRADALEERRVYADSPTVALERLARFAGGSTSFDHAWSTSTWTLPAHASMLTSLLPRQHGALGEFTQLAPSAASIAEVLRASGYRTVAVTDGIYVSAEYGLDQGFDVFDQTHGPRDGDPLARARAVLEHHDGRPTFLFVHTYVAHTPYQPSAPALATLGIEAPGEWSALSARLADAVAATEDQDRLPEVPEVQYSRDLYWAQMLDFDRHFGRFVDALDDSGWGASSVLVFTSDHGEAFGDHGQLFHGGKLYETQTRIPLLVRGGERFGLSAGARDDTASLVDLPPTFAALAGVAAPSGWIGRSLLTERTDAAAWMSIQSAERVQVGLAAGDDKVLALPDENVLEAFDLARDPDERHALGRLPARLEERYRRELGRTLEAVLDAPLLADPSAELLERLRAMGYLEDE
ncbi:Arylsulfatase [Planctomycetes bacterium Pla163]|uniref:Arylsulfatase n=1 Tax=Rohdeia mirabilis TaxID=2528008 RepID=A0A518D4R4_9BACT|nr:Arylsulfatase [Planctomycetes bacterium Pla163]